MRVAALLIAYAHYIIVIDKKGNRNIVKYMIESLIVAIIAISRYRKRETKNGSNTEEK